MSSIVFLLNGETVCINGDIEPTCTVLNYLREDLRLVGTKEGCAEGDCGACTVVIGELINQKLQIRAVNACIQFVPTLDGKALFTVEYLRQANGDLHPVQQAMVDCHGSQCGFCTPGFIMSLWSVYVNHQTDQTRPENAQLRTALSGNLCRCTGYRPILNAGEDMFNYPEIKFDWQTIEDKLKTIQHDQALHYQYGDISFHTPKTLQQLTELRSLKPDATLLAGSTDIGLWVNKQFRDLGDIIYIGEVKEFDLIKEEEDHLIIGAGATITDAYSHIARFYPEIDQQWQRFASVPIRNAGTLGGNVANGSPIGDSMPWLIVLGARVQLRNHRQHRTLPLEDLYLDYMQTAMQKDEIVEAVIVPKPQPQQLFRTYKVSRRYDSDISAVCAAFRITLDGSTHSDARIVDVRIAFGGMAATPRRALETERVMLDKPWNETTIQGAMAMLSQDYSPLSDMRASAQNRGKSAENLLYRFYLETRLDNPIAAENLTVFA